MSDNNQHFFGNTTSYSVEELVLIFRQLSEKITTLHEYSSKDFKGLSSCIREYYKQASIILQTVSQLALIISNQKRNLSEQAENSLQDISMIVTKLQFHDIIGQKLEHIQKTNQDIIDELLVILEGKENNKDNYSNKYTPIIPNIARLHAAQLTYTNTEYQNTFADIKANLLSIQNNTTIISEVCSTLFSLLKNEESSVSDAKGKSEIIIQLSNKLSAEVASSLEQIKYCGAFEKLVEEITNKLITIFPDLHTQTGNQPSNDNIVLKQLENLYTMETEREVHSSVFNTKDITDKDRNVSEDNLELF